jgi:hypothetical protein
MMALPDEPSCALYTPANSPHVEEKACKEALKEGINAIFKNKQLVAAIESGESEGRAVCHLSSKDWSLQDNKKSIIKLYAPSSVRKETLAKG